MTKKILLGAGVVVGVLVVALVAVAAFVDVDRFRPELQRSISAALGRQVQIGHIALSILSGSVAAEDVSIADDASFGGAPFVKAKSLKVGIEVLPLVFSRTLHVQSFRLQQPDVVLRRSRAGTWNFSTLGAASSSSSGGASSGLAMSVDSLGISDGRVTVESQAGGKMNSRVYENVSLEVRNFSEKTRFPFKLRARAPKGGAIALDGTAGPFSAAGVGAIPIDATLDVKQLDLASTGFVEPGSGIAGVVDLTLGVVSTGRLVEATGKLRAQKMQLMPGGSASLVPIDVECESDYELTRGSGVLKKADLHAGKATAHLVGRYNTSGDVPQVQMKLSGKAMPATDLQGLLPALGISTPQGAQFKSGGIDVDLTIAGPVDRLAITGPVKLSDGRLAGFDLGSGLRAIGPLAGLPTGSDTVIRTAAATLRVAPEMIRADALTLVVPSIGELTGEGTIAPSGALDFRMLAKLAGSTGMAGGVARLASLGHPENGVPFKVQGTTAKPVFVPDVGRALGSAVSSPKTASDVAGFAKKIFGKKK